MPKDLSNRPLTEKMRKFAVLWAKYGNARKAALEAGYTKASAINAAVHLGRDARVRALRDKMLEEAASKEVDSMLTNRDTIRRELWDNHQSAKKMRDFKSSNHALYLVGKDQGMFKDQVLRGDLDQELAGMSYEAMMAKIRALLVEILPGHLQGPILDAFDTHAAAPGGDQVSRGDADKSPEDVHPVSEAEGVSRARSH